MLHSRYVWYGMRYEVPASIVQNVLPSYETLLSVNTRDQSDYHGRSPIGRPTNCHGSCVLSICGTHTQQQKRVGGQVNGSRKKKLGQDLKYQAEFENSLHVIQRLWRT